MIRVNVFPLFLAILSSSCVFGASQIPAGQSDEAIAVVEVPPVQLLNVADGSMTKIEPNPKEKLTVLCFLGTECPLAKLYAGRLQAYSVRYPDVRFVGINSNVQDSLEDIKTYISNSKIKFEFAKDYENRFADEIGITRTPEVVVFDRSRKIIYRGRIDDQYLPGVSRSSATRNDLQIAIECALSGKPVEIAETEPEGCLLGRKRDSVKDATVTYANQVSRVLQRNCIECHRSGEIGPFSLESYEEAIGWADMMLEVIEEKRMPPWHADEHVGEFANARIMNAADREILEQWVEQGTPMGDVSKLPKPIKRVDGWRLPKAPDRIVAMSKQPFSIPADETVEYQYFVVDPQIEEDRWISAAEVIPGNRSVVHHCIVFIRPPDGVRMRGVGMLSGYVPGQSSLANVKGRALFLPKGSKLVFQMHYTPNGTPQQDLTKIGLVFADESEIENELFTILAIDQSFEIQPHDESHKVELQRGRLPRSGMLLSISPHMHYRGKSFESSYVSDAGETTLLIRVPEYDFNWQHRYEFANPIPLKNINRLKGIAEFDNSENNPFNPNPNELVWWGDQTWEEMAVAFYDVSVPRKSGDAERDKPNSKPSSARDTSANDKKIDRIANQFFDRFDANGDKVIVRSELPRSIRIWGFSEYDSDRNGELTMSEVREQARLRVRK